MAEPKKEHISWRDVYRLDDETIFNNDLPYAKWPKRVREFFDDMMDIYEKTEAGQEWMREIKEKHGFVNVVGTEKYMVGDRKLPRTGLGVPRSGRDMVVVMQNFKREYVLGDFKFYAESFRGIPLEQLATREMRLKLGAAMVGHEAGHNLNLPDDIARKMDKKFMDGVRCGENIAVGKYEERIRAELGLPPREGYADVKERLSHPIHKYEYELDKVDYANLLLRVQGKALDPEYEAEYKADMRGIADKLKSRAIPMARQNLFACKDATPADIDKAATSMVTNFLKERAKNAPEPKDTSAERQ